MRAAVLALFALAIACSAIALYCVANEPASRANVVVRDAALVAQVTVADAAGSSVDTAARTEREAALRTLRESGRADESWNAKAGEVFDEIKSAKSSETVSVVGCYVVGCAAMLAFRSEAAYRDEIAHVETLAAYRAWTGGKRITSPDPQPDGRVIVAVFLYRPD